MTHASAPKPRVLVITNQISAEQAGLWEAADASGTWEVHLAGPPPRPDLDAYVATGERPAVRNVHTVRALPLWPGQGHLWWLMPQLSGLLRAVRPHVVHVNSEPWGVLVSQALHEHPVVVAHGCENHFDFGRAVERRLRLSVARRNLRRLGGYASWNRAGEELARQHGLRPSAPSAVLPAITAADPGTRPIKEPRDRLVVGFVGRLIPEKGTRVLLEALALLASQDRQVQLRVVGDGLDAQLFESVRLYPVECLGRRSNAETRDIIAACDVLAVPSLRAHSWEEQFGRVVVEALAESVPVVVSSSGALPEVVGEAGTVVPEGDSRALAEALWALRAPDEREAKAEAARARYDVAYRPDVLARELIQLWDLTSGCATAAGPVAGRG